MCGRRSVTVKLTLVPTRDTENRQVLPHNDRARANPREPAIAPSACLITYARAAGARDPSVPGAMKLNTIFVEETARAVSPVT